MLTSTIEEYSITMTKHHRGHRDEKFRFVFMTGDPGGPGGPEGPGEFGPRGFGPGGHGPGEHGHGHEHGPRGRGRGNRRYGRGHDGGFPGFLGRGPRAGRGDVRAAILALLAEQPMHGYQIMREIGERSGGVWRPSPGSIYPTLQQLEDEELVRPETGDSGRRVFALTDSGREAQSASAGGSAPWDEVGVEGDNTALELRDLVGQVMAAARQVLHAGESAQIAQAKDVLRDARRKLYRILAEDSPEPTEAAPSEPDTK
jgi:DNA-binding PadR family transcriptional regulator